METQEKKRPGPKGSRLLTIDKKVQVYGYVPLKHYRAAQKEIDEICKKYR